MNCLRFNDQIFLTNNLSSKNKVEETTIILLVENNAISSLISHLNLNEKSTNESNFFRRKCDKKFLDFISDKFVCNLSVQNDILSILMNLFISNFTILKYKYILTKKIIKDSK